jgi:hypothetical protein
MIKDVVSDHAPNRRGPSRRRNILALLACLASFPAAAQNALVVGEIELDPATYCCLGLALPIVSGDDNYNAQVSVSYRAGAGAWRTAMPLMRVRPETVPFGFGSEVEEQFAGSIFDLLPGTVYEIRLDVVDPDGGNATRSVITTTRSLPPTTPAAPRMVSVDTIGEWQAALDSAQPGDVIQIENGVYNGTLTIRRSGTAANPIFVRGASQAGVTLNGTGHEHAIVVHNGSTPVAHVILEQFTITGSEWGIRLLGAQNVVVQNLALRQVARGINASTYVESQGRAYPNANLTICDNVLQGNALQWPFFETAAFNVEGIAIEGSGHVICHNTISGFGDAIGLEICYGGLEPSYCPLYPPPHRETVRNRAIDVYGNDILWGGDDGVELDFSERNVRAFRNRISNTGMGASLQPTWGGPVYVFQNVIYNVAKRVFKLNNEPTGFYLLHNTSIRNGIAWTQPSPTQEINGMTMLNNLLVGTAGDGALSLRTYLVMDTGTNNIVRMNHNGWFPNGPFTFLSGNFGSATYSSVAALAQGTPLEDDGVALAAPIFQSVNHVLGPIAAPPLAPLADVSLHATSNAIDRGMVLPNINDGYTGSAPDLGALELGASMPAFGPRTGPGGTPPVAPAPPQNLTAN